MKRDFTNFFGNSIADFYRCEIPDRDPDFVSFTGSAYWDCGNKIRRLSDHWGKLRTSIWFLDGKRTKAYYCGECYYSEFRTISADMFKE